MTEDELADLAEWEIEMFNHLNRRLAEYLCTLRQDHPSGQSTRQALRGTVDASNQRLSPDEMVVTTRRAR